MSLRAESGSSVYHRTGQLQGTLASDCQHQTTANYCQTLEWQSHPCGGTSSVHQNWKSMALFFVSPFSYPGFGSGWPCGYSVKLLLLLLLPSVKCMHL